MEAIKAIYDGKTFKPKQPITVIGQYEVVITFIEPIVQSVSVVHDTGKLPRKKIKGLLKDKVWIAADFNEPLEEMKELHPKI